jgi:hypothetical protein
VNIVTEALRATFCVNEQGNPAVWTEAPFERVGFFLMTFGSIELDMGVFTNLIPALDELQRGRQTSVSASSELVYLEASPTEVVLTEWDFDPPPPPCSVPLSEFIEVLRQWREYVASVLGS